MIRLEMQQYDEALTRTRTRKQELIARHTELKNVTNKSNADLLPASELLNNAYLGGLRGQYLTAMKERRELTAGGKGDNHPLVKSADKKLAQIKSAMVGGDEVKNIQGAIELRSRGDRAAGAGGSLAVRGGPQARPSSST